MYQYIYAFALGLITFFLVWKYSKLNELNATKWFDISLSAIFVSLLLSRLGFIFLNFKTYKEFGWSWFPYYTEITQRVWLENMPWRYLRFEEGISVQIGLAIFFLICLAYLVVKLRSELLINVGVLIIFLVMFNFGLLSYRYYGYWTDYGNIDLMLSFGVVLEILAIFVLLYFYLRKRIASERFLYYYIAGGFLLLGIINIFYPAKDILGYREERLAIASGIVLLCVVLSIIAWNKFDIEVRISGTRTSKNSMKKNNKVNRFLIKDDKIRLDSQKRGFVLSYNYMRRKDNYLKKIWENLLTSYYKILKNRKKDDSYSK